MSEINDNYREIYKGRNFSRPRSKNNEKVVAFDLDETLGSFTDLEILWRGILQCFNQNEPVSISFSDVLDLYPEFLRYGIIPILEFLLIKKRERECAGLYVYTNNQCPQIWTDMICDYLNKKVCANGEDLLFDKIIYAFKVNNKIVELSRTTNEKTYIDFIKCTLLPKNTEICFIDNTYYRHMNNSRVYYIKPLAYVHSLSQDEIITRFSNSDVGKKLFPNIKKMNIFCGFLMNEYNTPFRIENSQCNVAFSVKSPYEISRLNEKNTKFVEVCQRQNNSKKCQTDILVAQKIMYHVKEFFYLINRKQKTRKYKIHTGKFTRKR